MEVMTSFEQLQTAIQDLAQAEGRIVLHGTPRVAQIGDLLEPRISTRPARDENYTDVAWDTHDPYVFGACQEYPDVATFTATVMGVAPHYGAGIVEDPMEVPPLVRYAANDEVKAAVEQLDPVGTVCAVSGDSFRPSPRGSHFEVVSVKPVYVIGAWLVRHSALSFRLDELRPLTLLNTTLPVEAGS